MKEEVNETVVFWGALSLIGVAWVIKTFPTAMEKQIQTN
jgi:hypothetical protein